MAIKDLQARQGNVNLTLDIVEKAAVREFEKFGKKGRVCNAKAQDETGSITITLWNDDVDAVNVGDKIQIENGWVSEWQGELQLGTGKFGKLTIVGKGEAKPVETAPPKQDISEEEIL
ncbi:MAG: OB-fold nucleic acid binding domain-containing protein [Nanoarchaeota archaeon]|nr:OB-fold nucleic acid binding domain-containing protein [Nanoarchaeota archaeon]